MDLVRLEIQHLVGKRLIRLSSCKVSGVPGASALDVSACRAADSSPRCTRWRARWGGTGRSASSRSWVHRPSLNAARRAIHSCLGSFRTPGLRRNSMRGNKNHSFQARMDRSSWASRMQSPGRDARGPRERTAKCKHGAGVSGANPRCHVAPAPAGAADPPPAAAWGQEAVARCRSG